MSDLTVTHARLNGAPEILWVPLDPSEVVDEMDTSGVERHNVALHPTAGQLISKGSAKRSKPTHSAFRFADMLGHTS